MITLRITHRPSFLYALAKEADKALVQELARVAESMFLDAATRSDLDRLMLTYGVSTPVEIIKSRFGLNEYGFSVLETDR